MQYKLIGEELLKLENCVMFPLAQCNDMERMGVRKQKSRWSPAHKKKHTSLGAVESSETRVNAFENSEPQTPDLFQIRMG